MCTWTKLKSAIESGPGTDAVNWVGSIITTLSVKLQPLESVTTKLYVPAAKLVAFGVV